MTYEDQSINFKLQQTSKTSRPEFQLKVTFKTRPSAKRFRDNMFYFNTPLPDFPYCTLLWHPKFFRSIAFNFSWDGFNTQEEMKIKD